MSLYRGTWSTPCQVETTSFDDRIVDPISMDAYKSCAQSTTLNTNAAFFTIRGVQYFKAYSLPSNAKPSFAFQSRSFLLPRSSGMLTFPRRKYANNADMYLFYKPLFCDFIK